MEKPSELQIGKIVPQLTFEELTPVLIQLGLLYSEIKKIGRDCKGNTQNAMFLCLQQWRQKMLDAKLADIQIALVKEHNYTHILCKVNILAYRLLP